jgi:AraC family transcriptional regulator
MSFKKAEEYLFLKLKLHKTHSISEKEVSVLWNRNGNTDVFKVGETYLPDTIIVNPYNQTVLLQTTEREYRLEQNSAFFIKENEKFRIRHKTESSAEIMFLFLGNNSVKKYLDGFYNFCEEFTNINFRENIPVMHFNRLIRNQQFLNLLAADFLRNFDEYASDTLYLDGLEQKFLSQLIELRSDDEQKISNLSLKKFSTGVELYRRILRSVDYMHDSACENVSLDMLSREANISKFHYTRLFKQLYRKTPNSYFAGIKISRAQQLLKKTEIPVSDISTILGFENPSHFSLKFKKNTGISPVDYRMQNKKAIFYKLV